MSAVHAAIAARCSPPEWAVFFECRNGTGWDANRSADAVAMNLWPSRGLAIHGFEVKVSRADFLRELADPAKSAAVQKFCNHWWVAVSDEKVAKPEEMPPTWGLLVLRGAKLVQVKEAPPLKPEKLSRGFIASMLRRATEGSVPKAAVEALVAQRVEAHVASQHRSGAAFDLKLVTDELATLRKQVADFEKASGILMEAGRWRFTHEPAKVGAALAVILNGGDFNGRLSGLEQARNVAKNFVEQSTEAIAALKAIGAKS